MTDTTSASWNMSPCEIVAQLVELDDAVAFARTTRQGVLITMRANGHPQLSNVLQHCSEDGLIRVSVTGDRAKYLNLARRPWAALHVTRADFFAYAVLEGEVELTPVAASPDDATVDELVDLYRVLAGEHENWAVYRAAMVAERRAVIRLIPSRAYGMLESPSRSAS
ncbi:MAG TPA: PPOX class F420-dependent oxidoreductase [Acidimicrobiales bacterium]